MDRISPLLQALIDNLGESAAVLVLAALAMFSTKISTWWKDRSSRAFEKGINQNVRLRELLSELRVPYNADRICLYQFFNGSYYLAGGGIMKTILTHYVTKVGVANPNISCKTVVLTTQMVMSLKALQDNPASVFRQDTFPDDSFLDALFIETGSTAVFVAAVRDARKNWIGILCVDWLTDPGLLSEESLIKYAHQIGQFLSHND